MKYILTVALSTILFSLIGHGICVISNIEGTGHGSIMLMGAICGFLLGLFAGAVNSEH